jgi:hypothetical protein
VNDRLSDELLLTCGLLQQHGKQLGVCVNEWEKLKSEFALDVEATNKDSTLIGNRQLFIAWVLI